MTKTVLPIEYTSVAIFDATTYEQGNLRLMPEKSSNLDLGYGFKVERFQLFADAYANYTKDFITQITTMRNNLLITTYINTPFDFKTGLELNVRYAPLHWFDVTYNFNSFKQSKTEKKTETDRGLIRLGL